MPTFALELEYDGTPYVGWQAQDNGVAIQQRLEAAAANLVLTTPPISVTAGRTDSGVHAEAMVVQLTIDRDITPDRLRDALNYHLKPDPIVIRRAAIAAPGWNARFSAISRHYRYRILNRAARPALLLNRVWHVAAPLDAAAMHQAAQTLLGTHDFTSYRATACQAKSPIRSLERLDVTRSGDLIEFDVKARSFLHHQVRNFVGTLRLVGDGTWPISRPHEILAARNRAAAGPTAPAAGLTIIAVGYLQDPFTP